MNNSFLNRSAFDNFNDAYEAILKMNGDLNGEEPISVFSPLIQYPDPEDKELEKIKRLYTHVTVPEGKSFLARLILIRVVFDMKKGLLVVLDDLYFQHKIGNDKIREILKKNSLFSDNLNLETDECNAIISVMLDFLETPCPDVWSFNDLVKFRDKLMEREHAAHILLALKKYPKTSEKSKVTIQKKGDLIVIYDSIEDDRDVIGTWRLRDYPSFNE